MFGLVDDKSEIMATPLKCHGQQKNVFICIHCQKKNKKI